MIVYSLLLVTLLLAVAALYTLWRNRVNELRNSCSGILLSVALATFIYLYGAWLFLSVYTRYVFAVCFIILLVAVLFRKKNVVVARAARRIVANLSFTLLLCVLVVLYYTGTTGKPYGVTHLALPFKTGKYIIFQGGKGLPTNLFHYGLRGAVFAIDIAKLNDNGMRAKHIFSKELSDYAIYGDTVYSPCNGRILNTAADNKDNIPPHLTHSNNHVLIDGGSCYVFLGHLKQGCVFVQAGDSVLQGQALGCAGNTGFSIEPHLHIQAHAKTDTTIPWYKEPPLLIAFDGKSYLLFDVITAR